MRKPLATLCAAMLITTLVGAPAAAQTGFTAPPADIFTDVLGFSRADAEMLGGSTQPIATPPFKFADDPGGPPSLTPGEAPWATPTGMGGAFVELPDGYAPPVVDPGKVSVTSGEGLVAGRRYLMLWATFDAVAGPGELGDLTVNISFPTATPGAEFWNPLTAFPADTWGGFSIIPYLLNNGPGTWAFAVSQVVDGGLVDRPFDGAAVFCEGVVVFLVDADTVLPPGADPDDVMIGFAVHVHDGSFGSQPDSISTISAVPAIPPGTRSDERQGLPLTAPETLLGTTVEEPAVTVPEEPAVTVPEEPAVTVPEEPAVTVPEEPAVTVPEEPAVTVPEEPAVVDPGQAAPAGSEGGGSPAVPILIVVVGLAGIGGFLVFRRRGDGATLTPEPSPWPEVIAASPPASTTSSDIIVPAKGEGGTATLPPKIGLRGWKP